MVRLAESSTILLVGAMAVRSSDEKHGAMAAGRDKKHERGDGILNSVKVRKRVMNVC